MINIMVSWTLVKNRMQIAVAPHAVIDGIIVPCMMRNGVSSYSWRARRRCIGIRPRVVQFSPGLLSFNCSACYFPARCCFWCFIVREQARRVQPRAGTSFCSYRCWWCCHFLWIHSWIYSDVAFFPIRKLETHSSLFFMYIYFFNSLFSKTDQAQIVKHLSSNELVKLYQLIDCTNN